MSRNKRWWVLIGLITVAAVALRVFYILKFRTDLVPNKLADGTVIKARAWGDGLVFHRQANLVADGEGLIAPLPFELVGVRQASADHPPLYTAYLALWSILGIRSEVGHMLLTAPLGALAAPTFGVLGRRVAGPAVGLVAALIGAFNPSIVHYPGFVLSEAVTIPLAALVAYAWYRLYDHPTLLNAAYLGGFTGLAVLTRAELAMLVPFAIIPLILILLRRLPWRDRLALLAVTGVVTGALVLPWVGYNLNRFEEPVTMSIGFDYSLVQGNCDESYGYGDSDLLGYYWLGCMGEALEGTGLAYVDQSLGSVHLRAVALDYIESHKRRAVVATLARVGRVAGVYKPLQQARLNGLIAGRERWLANTSVLLWYPMVALAIIGAVSLRRRGRTIFPLVALVASAFFAVAITLAVLRYRASLEPALAVLCAVGVMEVGRFFQRAWTDDDTDQDPASTESGRITSTDVRPMPLRS